MATTQYNAERFENLAHIWLEQCAQLSSIREITLHPSYQQIVEMGEKALPFIFARLEREPEHWFWALRAITGENPVPSESRGNIAQMVDAWLKWAQKNGFQTNGE